MESGKSRYKGRMFFSVKSIKLFGLHLKSNLHWENEIKAIVRKCGTPMKIVNCVKNTWRGADPVILMRFYKVLISSGIEYWTFLFRKLKNKRLQKLEKLQYRATGGALGYPSSTPANMMVAKAKEIPIFNSFKQLGRNYISINIRQAISQWSICWRNYQF
jgi:hypothetical protein